MGVDQNDRESPVDLRHKNPQKYDQFEWKDMKAKVDESEPPPPLIAKVSVHQKRHVIGARLSEATSVVNAINREKK